MVYFRLLGRLVLRLFLYLGELASLVGQICESLLQGRRRWRQFFEQIVEIGYRSQAVVVITKTAASCLAEPSAAAAAATSACVRAPRARSHSAASEAARACARRRQR